MRNKLIYIVILAFISPFSSAQDTTTIFITLDGFRYDYIDLYPLKNLKKISESGVKSKGIYPVIPSYTAPNLMSINTGLGPDKHGIVSNNFYSTTLKKEYRLEDSSISSNPIWYKGDTLWAIAEKAGIKTAVFSWLGSNFLTPPPSLQIPYSYDLTINDALNAFRKWMDLKSVDRPKFIMMYWSLADTIAHQFGPESSQLKNAVIKIDESIGTIMEVAKEKNLAIDWVIAADHGMSSLNKDQCLLLEKYLDISNFMIYGNGTFITVYFKNQSSKKQQEILKNLSLNSDKFKVKIGDKDRLGDFFIETKPGFYFQKNALWQSKNLGGHGWNPREASQMKGVFLASGPSFKKGLKLREFDITELHTFILRTLRIKTKPLVPLSKDLDQAFSKKL